MPNLNGNGKSCSKNPKTVQRMDLRSQLHRLEKAVRTSPERADHWFDLGKLLLDTGQNQQAEAAFQEALRRAPDSATYRYYLGNALGNCGKFQEAADHFRHLAAIDPELQNPMSMIGLSVLTDLAYCQGEMGQWKEAFATLHPAVNTAISILGDLAAFLANSKEYDRACFLYSVALFLAPGDPELLHGAGHCHMNSGRLQEALTHLRKARRADPRDPDISYELGLTLSRMGKSKRARPCFRRALQLDPKYFRAWYDLACLDALENKPDSAFRNLYKSIECGFSDVDYLRQDTDFKAFHKDPRWRLVLDCISDNAKAKSAITPIRQGGHDGALM